MNKIEINYIDYVVEITETTINGWLTESEHRRLADSVIRMEKAPAEWVITRCPSILTRPRDMDQVESFAWSRARSKCMNRCFELADQLDEIGFKAICKKNRLKT